MAEVHGEVFVVTAGIPGLNASLLHVNAHLDDVIGPSVDQLTANLRLADSRLTDSEENIENVISTWNASRLELTGKVPEYIRTMSEEVSSLEAVRQRVEGAAQSTVGVLESLNRTVIDIEMRSAAALNTSQQALQLSQTALVQQRQIAVDLSNIRRQLNASDTDIIDVGTGISDVTATASQIMTSAQAVQANVTTMTSDTVDLSAAVDRVTQLEADVSNVHSQVQQAASKVTATTDDVYRAGSETSRLASNVSHVVAQWDTWFNRATAAQRTIAEMTSQAEMTSSRARDMLDILVDFDERSEAEQRRANESLAAVHTVFQLSRSVVNESLSLQSNLETIEADALAAQQRTSQQYSAVSALSQSMNESMSKLSSLQSTLSSVSSSSSNNATLLMQEISVINSTDVSSAESQADQLVTATDALDARRSEADVAVHHAADDARLLTERIASLRNQLASVTPTVNGDGGTEDITRLQDQVRQTLDDVRSRGWDSTAQQMRSSVAEQQTSINSLKLKRDDLRAQLTKKSRLLAMFT